MQTLLTSNGLDDIPTKPIDVDPPTLCPLFLWLIKEAYETCVIEVALDHIILREIDDRNLAGRLKRRHRSMASIGEHRVVARFRARLPTWPIAKIGLEVIVIFNGLERWNASYSASQYRGRKVHLAMDLGVGSHWPYGLGSGGEVLGVESEIIADMLLVLFVRDVGV